MKFSNLSTLGVATLFLVTACGRVDHIGKPPEFNALQDSPANAARAYATQPIVSRQQRVTDSASLWSGGQRSLLGDRRAMKLGDILTVVIEIDESAQIDNSTTRSANVTAMTRTRVVTVPQSLFLSILRDSPDVALQLMRSMAILIRSLNTRLAEHAFLPAKYRLYSELIRLSKPRKGHDQQRIISPPPIQLELAERIGCRREVVSREIAKMERENVVERSRGGLILADMNELNRRLSEGWNAGAE